MTVRLIAIKIWCQHSCSHQDGSLNPVARISVGIELFGWLVAFWQFFVVATRCAHALRLGFVKHLGHLVATNTTGNYCKVTLKIQWCHTYKC